MKRFDYSFLENGLLPANLINITGTIYSLKTGATIRKDEYERIFTELEKIAVVQSVKSSNAIEGIVTSDERIEEIVNQNSKPLNHNENEIAGYLILQHKKPLYVQSLYLLPEFQRKGIGRKTFEFIRENCRKEGTKKFYLGCHPENKNALAFYEKMGGAIAEKDVGHENNRENSFKIEFDL